MGICDSRLCMREDNNCTIKFFYKYCTGDIWRCMKISRKRQKGQKDYEIFADNGAEVWKICHIPIN